MKQQQTVQVITLGCPKNIVDSEVLIRQLGSNHFELAPDGADPDIAIINTCGFINDAKQESIDTILHALKLKKEQRIKKVLVMGCLIERYQRELELELPEVDAFVGTNKLDEVLRTLGGSLQYELLGERVLTTPPHYAYLKISEGCDRPCSFCSIPRIRGKHVSKPIEQIVTEAAKLASVGVKELIVIAQDSTYYGLDLYGKRLLGKLLQQLGKIEGIEWIRLMYAFPSGFPDDVLEQLNENPKLCRYLDIPVQHVSDVVLESMKRGIGSVELQRLLHRIREKVPGIALRSTLIVGYPNEGEKEFSELLRFVEDTEFERLGVFMYSQEDDTSAFPLGDPVPHHVKEERMNIIMETQNEIARRKNQLLVNTSVRVLVDRKDGITAIGRTQFDAPEVDNEITISDAHQLSPGSFSTVQIVGADAYDLFANVQRDSGVELTSRSSREI
jgi:ribosomal protein S12 methylthiotransferase